MTKSLPEPLMLNGKPHYSARQIAEMGLPGLPGTRQGVKAKALSESWPRRLRPLGSWGREGVSARSPAGRGASENPPTCTAQTHATRSYVLSLHPKEAEREKAPLSRPRAGSEGDGRGEGRGGASVETLQEARLRGRYPSATPARLSAHSGRPATPERRSGRAKPCRRSASPPCTTGTELWRGAA